MYFNSPPPPPALHSVCLAAFLALATVCGNVGASVGGAPNESAPRAAQAIKDAQGRIRYIVDLVEDNTGRPAKFDDPANLIAFAQSRSAQQIADVTKLRGVEILGTTSLIGTSFTAFLTEKQVEQLSKDKRVSQLTQDVVLQRSALWNSTTDPYGQVRPWGLQAMGVANAGSSSGYGVTVYVLDTGVEFHSDLNLTERLTATPLTSSGQPVNPTGCFAHSTHVAGIIGARDNGFGVVGVYPNVKLVSIALGDSNPSPSCPAGSSVSAGSDNATSFTLIQGLEKIYQRVLQSHQVAIVNLSFNIGGGVFASTTTVGLKMKKVAAPSYLDGGYPGALIVQSAGNSYPMDACSSAYGPASPYDGIIVVGGLDENGQQVVPIVNNSSGYYNSVLDYNSLRFNFFEPGSNTGSCVEVWAPSRRIKSTWTGNGYQFLSGTSMAAPHIAGLAARLLESDPYITTSTDLEAAVRAHFTTIVGSNLTIAQLSPVSVTANPTIEIVEGNAPYLNRSSLSPTNTLSFNKYPEEVTGFQFAAVGAKNPQSCVGTFYKDSPNHYFYGWLTTGYIAANGSAPIPRVVYGFPQLTPGQYTFEVTCVSPQWTQTTAVANVTIKQRVTLQWEASTSVQNLNWQVIGNGGAVTWSVSANAPFDQKYSSTGANNCHIFSYGYWGDKRSDSDNPAHENGYPPFYQQQLWDSDVYGPAPTSYTFARFYFGQPPSPYLGYKWLLTCYNASPTETKSTVMYGSPAP